MKKHPNNRKNFIKPFLFPTKSATPERIGISIEIKTNAIAVV